MAEQQRRISPVFKGEDGGASSIFIREQSSSWDRIIPRGSGMSNRNIELEKGGEGG